MKLISIVVDEPGRMEGHEGVFQRINLTFVHAAETVSREIWVAFQCDGDGNADRGLVASALQMLGNNLRKAQPEPLVIHVGQEEIDAAAKQYDIKL